MEKTIKEEEKDSGCLRAWHGYKCSYHGQEGHTEKVTFEKALKEVRKWLTQMPVERPFYAETTIHARNLSWLCVRQFGKL